MEVLFFVNSSFPLQAPVPPASGESLGEHGMCHTMCKEEEVAKVTTLTSSSKNLFQQTISQTGKALLFMEGQLQIQSNRSCGPLKTGFATEATVCLILGTAAPLTCSEKADDSSLIIQASQVTNGRGNQQEKGKVVCKTHSLDNPFYILSNPNLIVYTENSIHPYFQNW